MIKTKLNVVFAFLVVILMLGPFAKADGEVIRNISVRSRGDVPVETTHVLSHISSANGDVFSPDIVAKDVQSILETKQYSYADIRVEPSDNGVSLVFVVEARRRLTSTPEILGNRKMRKAKILKSLNLQVGDFVDEQVVRTAFNSVIKEYKKKNYPAATGSIEVVPFSSNPSAATVKIRIKEGEKLKTARLEFSGNKAIKASHLRKISGQSPWWNPTGWFTDKRVDDFDLETLRSDVRRQYAEIGYLDADVSSPRIRLENGIRNVSFLVTEGPCYKIGNVSIDGVTLFTDVALRSAVGIQKGVIGSSLLIEHGATVLRDFYTSRGYIDTLVKTAVYPAVSTPGVINVAYTVKEGRLVHLRDIRIRGNRVTKDKVIRREINLNPGDIYNGVDADRSERRLMNLGYFENVRHYDFIADSTRRDLIYEVDEKSTGNLMVGAGFSSVDHLIGFMEISQSNFDVLNWPRFTGGGQKARLGLEISGDATDVEASFVEPWFLDRRLSLNVDGFAKTRGYSEYDERSIGGSVGLSKHVPWVGRVGISYTIQQNSLSDIIEGEYESLDVSGEKYRYTDENDGYMMGSLKLSWTYDTRDNPMIPNRGTRARASASLYGAAFGGDYDMYELNCNIRHYIPTFYGHVISFYVRSDVIDAFGSDDYVPISSRYFLGGGRNVRGFRYRALSPKVRAVDAASDSKDYRPVGGRTLFTASAEYTVPVFKFFRIAAFWDIGNVWKDSYDYDSSEYASSAGMGIRLDLPGFPLRFDYAVPLERDDEYSREQKWVFWVGFD